jgi:1-pyrroline-5-carboxylate dehydrogenase
MNGTIKIPTPSNEPVKSYAPGSPERASLKAAIKKMAGEQVDIPLIIGGKEVRTGETQEIRAPHDHSLLLGRYHKAGEEEVRSAIKSCLDARREWAAYPFEQRAAIFLRMAELLAGPWRDRVNAATMLGQSKNAFQAEIDSACELIDFWRFNPSYASEVYAMQPRSSPGVWNRVEYRGLEGFVLAVTPFNFTCIAGNLPSSPALMGCVSIWKPASSAVLSAYHLMELMREAGMPDGVINFVPGPGRVVGPMAMEHPDLGGVHFTGSTAVFQDMWKTVGNNIANYRTYPRIVGETGGKDFIFAHSSADVNALVTALTRGAFEFQGQKCSAASRAYIPESLWPGVKEALLEQISRIKVGNVSDFTCFMNAVIDKNAFRDITGYIDYAKEHGDEAEILAGGEYDDSEGFFIHPTVILTRNPKFKTMQEEIFGPVLTLYVYPDGEYDDMLKLCDETSPYALTGAIFARDRSAIMRAHKTLEHAAGNYYVNDKPTGAVVSQQPFGGSRASGTNDKAGSLLNLIRWTSARAIKETFVPPTDFAYPFMGKD